MKELQWVSSHGPPPVVLEGLQKIDSIEAIDGTKITYYYDSLDEVCWRADEVRGRCNWYISTRVRV